MAQRIAGAECDRIPPNPRSVQQKHEIARILSLNKIVLHLFDYGDWNSN
ncbi:hypothetical protein LC609_32485 [Nostoc sp. XA013]|nr:hypothetical protein [Nostoc sp. XA013]